MASWAEVYFGARFKKVPGGWIFMSSSKRLFEKRDHYLVTDRRASSAMGSQKPVVVIQS